jgi:hypothetical protein
MRNDLVYIITVYLYLHDVPVILLMDYGLEGLGLISVSARSFSSPQCPEQLWDPPSLLSDGYWE